MIYYGPDPIPRESDVVTSERIEQAALKDAEDRGQARHNHDDYDPDDTGYNWPQLAANFRLRNDVPEPPDPWVNGQIQCQRCDEFHEPYCSHGNELCACCAPSGCQSCACEQADYAAIVEERQREWWA